MTEGSFDLLKFQKILIKALEELRNSSLRYSKGQI